MLNRAFEYFLINILNGAKRKRQQRTTQPATKSLASPLFPPSDYTILGHVIPDTDDPANDPITRQLNDAGVVALSPEARMRHLYLLGATGTGKTNLLLRLIESDIQNRRTFCVVDLRGDLVDRILLRLAAAPASLSSERLLLLDLRDRERCVGFNPLQSEGASGSVTGSGDFYTRALLMLSVLKKQSDSWGVQLEDTLRHTFMALAESGWSLLEARPLLTNPAFRQQVLQQVRDPQVHTFFQEFAALSNAERTSRSAAALNKLSPLLSVPALRVMFGQRQGFLFSSLLNEQPGRVILISLGVDRLHDAARLTGGLLISSLQAAIMARVDQPESQRVPTQLYVDEFECMASDKFEEIVAEGRRFQVGLTLSHQNLSQLPLRLRQVIRNNVQTQVYFQTGALDASELAKEIGHGRSSSEVRATLMSQGVGEAFLVRRGQPSARMQTQHSVDPPVNAQQIRALRAISATIYGRPRTEVEKELENREAEFLGIEDSQSLSSSKAPGGTTVYQIRHDKLDHFAPGTPVPGAVAATHDQQSETDTTGLQQNEAPGAVSNRTTGAQRRATLKPPKKSTRAASNPDRTKVERKSKAKKKEEGATPTNHAQRDDKENNPSEGT